MTPQDQILLSDFLSTLSLPDLARRHNLHLTDLVTWADRPDIAAAIADIIRIADLRSRALAATSSPQALATLEHLSTLNESPTTPIRLFRESTRKACAALLRHSKSKTNSRPRTHHKSEPPASTIPKTQPPAAQPTGSPRTQFQTQTTLTTNGKSPRHPTTTSPIPHPNSPPHPFTPTPTDSRSFQPIPFPTSSPLPFPLPSAPPRPASAPPRTPSPPARLKAAAGGLSPP